MGNWSKVISRKYKETGNEVNDIDKQGGREGGREGGEKIRKNGKGGS